MRQHLHHHKRSSFLRQDSRHGVGNICIVASIAGLGERCSEYGSVPARSQCRRATHLQAERTTSRTVQTAGKKATWIDCDPGHDDAIALMLACTHPSLDVKGVSTVACNQTVDKTTDNALAVLHAIGYEKVKVYRGQAKPIIQENVHCAEIHGPSGLDGPDGGRLFSDSPYGPQPETAVLAIADQICRLEAEDHLPLQLICTGCLTNAALLLTLFPHFACEKYVNITLMGGAMGIGNTGGATPTTASFVTSFDTLPCCQHSFPGRGAHCNMDHTCSSCTCGVPLLCPDSHVAEDYNTGLQMKCKVGNFIRSICENVSIAGPVQEFNIMTDPHAAAIVFDSGVHVTMVPIEVTHTVLASPEVVGRISSLGTPFADRVVDLIHFFADTYKSVFQFGSPPIHDAVAVAYIIAPHIFETKCFRVDVDLCSSLGKGQTVCDVWGQSGRPPNIEVVQRVEVGECWDLIICAIGQCNQVSPLNT